MSIKRGDNFKGFNTRVAAVSGAAELEAFDMLGPISREAIRNSPIKWLAVAIIQQIQAEEQRIRAMLPEDQREGFRFNLQDPDLDRNIARGLAQQTVQIVAKDRSQEDALSSIVPLRPRKFKRAMSR